jgi:hypothetical protein
LLKKRYKGRQDEEENISRYWMTLRKDEILEFKRKRTISHSLENSLWKEAMDLLQDRLCNE